MVSWQNTKMLYFKKQFLIISHEPIAENNTTVWFIAKRNEKVKVLVVFLSFLTEKVTIENGIYMKLHNDSLFYQVYSNLLNVLLVHITDNCFMYLWWHENCS